MGDEEWRWSKGEKKRMDEKGWRKASQKDKDSGGKAEGRGGEMEKSVSGGCFYNTCKKINSAATFQVILHISLLDRPPILH